MTDPLIEKMRDPKFYLENFCKIKSKERGLVPFILKEAQKDFFNTLSHYKKVIILKARQLGFCLDKNTKILSSNLRWITLNDIEIGQEIIGVDEQDPIGRGNGRKMRKAIVERKSSVFEDAFRLKMDNDEELIATAKHRFLGKNNGSTKTTWRRVEDIKLGEEIRYITKPWGDSEFEDGWFGGMIDGEGCLRFKNHSGAEINVAQRVSPLFDRIVEYAKKNNYSFTIESDCRKNSDGNTSKYGNQVVKKVVFSRMNELFCLLGKTRPKRFVEINWWEGKDFPGKRSGEAWAKVVSIEALGKREMIDIQTSTKTFIAEGFISHNSSAVTGYFYVDTIMNPGTNTGLVGYNSEMVTELLDKVRTLIKTTPLKVRPTIKYDSKYEISFPKIDSKIVVLPLTDNVGRGWTFHNVLATELSAWDNAERRFSGLSESVPPNGTIVIESTPRGQGNLYHRMWMMENEYVKKEYGWWWEYTKDQMEVKKRSLGPQMFAQEYGLEFLASGRPVFDQEMIRQQRNNILNVGDKNGKDAIVIEQDGWRVYRAPSPDGIYVCGADVSEGVSGGDYSVATIWDRKTGEEVAFFRDLIAADRFGDKLNKMGRIYNNCLMVVEVNASGLTTVLRLKDLIYPSMYFRPSKFDALSTTPTDRLGWRTTPGTRIFLIEDFAKATREGDLIIHSKEILNEMSVFIYNDNNDMVPQPGFHDDSIFASAIAFQGWKITYDKPLTQIDESAYLPKHYAY